jgi:cellulose synthase/poly-beta-1,6-N-acetylglucosamine synthase-like glycosyltransferase
MTDVIRMVLFFIAVLMTLGIALVPSYVGVSLPGFELDTKGDWVPNSGAESVFYLLMNVYYILFVLFSITPFLTLILWSIASKVKKYTIEDEHGGATKPDRTIFSEGRGPKVSVVIPCYNEAHHVGTAVMSALRQTYEGDIEVIVVDDGSTDQTWSIGRTLKMNFPNRSVKVIHRKNGGKASALTKGIEESTGDLIITTDGDSQLDIEAVREIVKTFTRYPDAGIVGGFVSIKNAHVNVLTRLQEFEYVITQEMIRVNQSEDGSVLIAPGPVFGIRADIARLLNPIDRTIVEDCDLTQTILSTKMTTRSNEKAISNTHAPETVGAWIAQRKRWIFGQFQAWRENKWHLMHNPWAVYTYFTWVSTALSAGLLLGFLITTIALVVMGSRDYTLMGFITARSLIVLLLYFLTRALIILPHKEIRPYLVFLPFLPIYDVILSILSVHLYLRYILGLGTRIRWGGRMVVVH